MVGNRELPIVFEGQRLFRCAVAVGMDAAVVNAIARVTGGNFRLVDRLFIEIQRVMAVNSLSTLTTEVVAFARESLAVGPT